MLYMFIFIGKLVNLLFSVCFATGYIHSGEIKIFNSALVSGGSNWFLPDSLPTAQY